MKIKLTLILLLLFSPAMAQLKMPSFEVAVKAGYVNIGDDVEDDATGNYESNTYEGGYVQGEISAHVGQHIAIGYFYQQSVMATYRNSDSNSINYNYDSQHLMHGVNLRFSTGRSSKFRAYLQLKYFASEFVVDHGDFELARKGPGASGGVGVMMRVGHSLYINLLEFEAATLLSDSDVLFSEGGSFPTGRIGVTYNFSKRK